MATRGELNQQSAPLEPEPRELAAVFLAMRRHFRFSIAIVLGCIALAALLSLVLPKSYTADATLSYDPQTPLIRGGGDLAMTDAQRDAEIDAQLGEVTTLPVAEDVAHSLDLAANPGLLQEADAWSASSERKLSRVEALGTALLDHVKARRVGQTPVFTISFSASSAVQAARIANGFAASYLKAAARQKAALADGSTRQLASHLAQLRQQATAAQAELAAFRLANHLLDNPDSTALEQAAAVLRGQLADARGQAAAKQNRALLVVDSDPAGDDFLRAVHVAIETAPNSRQWQITGDDALLPRGIFVVPGGAAVIGAVFPAGEGAGGAWPVGRISSLELASPGSISSVAGNLSGVFLRMTVPLTALGAAGGRGPASGMSFIGF